MSWIINFCLIAKYQNAKTAAKSIKVQREKYYMAIIRILWVSKKKESIQHKFQSNYSWICDPRTSQRQVKTLQLIFVIIVSLTFSKIIGLYCVFGVLVNIWKKEILNYSSYSIQYMVQECNFSEPSTNVLEIFERWARINSKNVIIGATSDNQHFAMFLQFDGINRAINAAYFISKINGFWLLYSRFSKHFQQKKIDKKLSKLSVARFKYNSLNYWKTF